MESLMEGHKKFLQKLEQFSKENESGLDSVGRLNTSIFYGEDPNRWVCEAEKCFSRIHCLDAAVACFHGEAWAWFEWIDRIRSVQTWEELKSLMLKKFLTSSVVDGEEFGCVEYKGIAGILVSQSQVHEIGGQIVGAKKTMNRIGGIADYYGEVKESNGFDELKRRRVAAPPEKIEKLSINKPFDLKNGLPVSGPELNRLFPSREVVTEEENVAWREQKKNEQIAEKMNTVGTKDLLKGRRMVSVRLNSGLGYELGFQVDCIEETHVTKGSGGENSLGSNPNPIWDPGIYTAKNLEKWAEIHRVWVRSGPTPSGGPIKLWALKEKLASSVRSQPSFKCDTAPASNWYQSSHPLVQRSKSRLSRVPFSGLDLVDGGLLQEEGESRSIYVTNLSKFQNKSSEYISNDPSRLLLCALNDEEKYCGGEPLIFSCPNRSSTFNCPTNFSSICALISQKPGDSQAGNASDFCLELQCPICPKEGGDVRMSSLIVNQVLSEYSQGVPNVSNSQNQSTLKNISYLDFQLKMETEKCKIKKCGLNDFSIDFVIGLPPPVFDYGFFILVDRIQNLHSWRLEATGYGVSKGAILQVAAHSLGMLSH